MKKIILPLAAIVMMVACNNAPDADKAETGDKQAVAATEGTIYTVDTISTITWTGSKPTGSHVGTFKIKEGSVAVKDGAITGGSFVIDANSLTNMDLATDPKSKAQLEGHLKSPDFFDVAKYPTVKFEITGVEPFKYDSTNSNTVMKDATHLVKGNLTLKDSTKNISFPTKVVITENNLAATADFNIDRTQWGLNYKGPNNPQDWFIRKEVNLKLNFGAVKK